jgi:hypothetical protein
MLVGQNGKADDGKPVRGGYFKPPPTCHASSRGRNSQLKQQSRKQDRVARRRDLDGIPYTLGEQHRNCESIL